MKSQSVVLTAVAAALLLILFVAGAVYVNQPRPPAASQSTPSTAPAIVETSPATDATPDAAALPTIPPPPSFGGSEADAAADRVTAYLRWVGEMETRRHMALGGLKDIFGNSDGNWGRALERGCRNSLAQPPPPPRRRNVRR